MLKRRIRNATAAASPVKASGVAEMSVLESAPSARNAASKSRRNVGSGAWPVAARTTAMIANATTSEPSGTATVEPPALDEALLDPDGRPDHRTPAISSPSSSTSALAPSASPDDRALVHDDDPVGERQHLVEVLADQEDADAVRRRVAEVRRAPSRSRRRRGLGSARRRRGASAGRRTRGRGRPSAGCRRTASARARRGRSPARRSGASARAPGRGCGAGAGTARASPRRGDRT